MAAKPSAGVVGPDHVARADFHDGSPSKLTDLRGQTMSAAGVLHSMAFQKKEFHIDALPVTAEFDYVVAGAGLSGLSAAYFYKKRFGADKKILILDTLEDFGGHAKRNEFHVNGETILGYGGSESLQSPKANFTETVHSLLKELKIDLDLFDTKYFQHNVYPDLGLSRGSFFGGEYGNKLVTGDPTPWVSDDVDPARLNAKPLDKFLGSFPVSEAARAQLLELYTSKRVSLSHLSNAESKIEYLSKTSYAAFLKKDWGLSDEAVSYFHNRTLDFFGLSPSMVSALDAGHYGYPGLQGVEVPHNEEASGDLSERYIHHFPDGNASVARLLVRSLIPSAAKGDTMEDIVLASFNYKELDQPHNPVRIRLNSSLARAANTADGFVDVGVVNNVDNTLYRVRAKHVTLACYNMTIPFIVPTMPKEQLDALKLNVKAPLVYTNVAVKNWEAWKKLGIHEIYGVNTFHSRVKLDYPVKIGQYSSSLDPSKPVLLHMVHVPSVDASEAVKDPRTALRLARKTLFAKKFEDFEKAIRADLAAMLGPGGFQDSDIVGITVNRWSHGYAYGSNPLAETEEEGRKLMEQARQAFGNITIANSDSAWSAYAHSAIDEAHRAVSQFK